MNDYRKINIASYRVLRTLQCLFEQNMTMDELVSKLSAEFSDGYNNFVASKYINTCRSCGIDIQKIKGQYVVMNIPFGKKFTGNEVELLYEISQYSKGIKSHNVEQHIEDFLSKLHITLFKSGNGIKSSENYRIIKQFEKALAVNSDIELVFNNGDKQHCTPSDIIINDEKLVFKVNKDGREEIIIPDELSDIRVEDENAKKAKFISEEVIFELSGKLAKRYQLRENEQIIKVKRSGTIVISNKYENHTDLKRRLMRYDALCKVVKPQEFADEMKDNIIGALANYTEEEIDSAKA